MLRAASRRVGRSVRAGADADRPTPPDAGRRPRVDVGGCAPATRARLGSLADRSGAFVVGDGGGSDADVLVVTLGDEDGHRVADLRRRHRAAPTRRTVVIGEGTTWFDAAFGAGVDAWIDHTADDATVLVAILGRAPGGRAAEGRTT